MHVPDGHFTRTGVYGSWNTIALPLGIATGKVITGHLPDDLKVLFFLQRPCPSMSDPN